MHVCTHACGSLATVGKFCSINICRILINLKWRLDDKGHQYRSLALRVCTWQVGKVKKSGKVVAISVV